jgi:hypothetical protein
MATTGERLVDLSILTTGTALDHFLNIGGGGGVEGGDATDYFEEALMKLIFLNEPIAGLGDQVGIPATEIAGNLYVGLFTDDPGESGVFTNEADYDGYTRLAVIRGAGGWEWNNERIQNSTILTWPPIVSGSETVSHIAIIDSLTGGNVLFKKDIGVPKTITTGDQYQLAVSNLILILD